jgi:hypothetical protein
MYQILSALTNFLSRETVAKQKITRNGDAEIRQ